MAPAYDACVAHQAADLRNGLTPIVLLVAELERHLATDVDASPALVSLAACLHASVDVMIDKVKRLGDFPRVVPSRLSLTREDVELTALVREACARRAATAAASGAELRVDAPAPVIGRWDAAVLREIVDHLLASVIEQSARTPIAVVVGRRGRRATLSVTARLPGGADALSGGGVGLWPVRLLCAGMNGRLTITDAGESHARFLVTLPVS